MRLIDADRLLSEPMKNKYYHLKNGDTAVPLIDIKNAPPVDAVPVVRCRDCKLYKPEVGDDEYALGWCPFIKSHLVMNMGFCFWGKRKEENNALN